MIKNSKNCFDPLLPLYGVLAYIFVRVYIKAIYSLFDPSGLRWEYDEGTLRYTFLLLNVFILCLTAGWVIGYKVKPIFYVATKRRQYIDFKILFFGFMVACIAIQYYALWGIIKEFGGIAETIVMQSAMSTLIKDLDLGVNFALMTLALIPVQVLIIYWLDTFNGFKMPFRYKFSLVVLLVIVILPFVIISRRSPLLLLFLPILYYYHYRIARIGTKVIAIVSTSVVVAFTLISVVRMNMFATNFSLTDLFSSPEFGIFDMLVYIIGRHEQLTYLMSLNYLYDNPKMLLEYNMGSVALQHLTGFEFSWGGAVPTIIATFYLTAGFLGVLLFSLILGAVLGFLTKSATRAAGLIFLSGYILFYAIQIVSNGDLVLQLKIAIRYVLPAIAFYWLLYSVKIRRIRYSN